MKDNAVRETKWYLIDNETHFECKLQNGESFNFKVDNNIKVKIRQTDTEYQDIGLFELELGDEVVEIRRLWKTKIQ